MQRKKI